MTKKRLSDTIFPMKEKAIKFGEFTYKYRFLIAVILIALGTIFNLSGSSIAMMGRSVGTPDEGTLLGVPRSIRSDEFGTLTPLITSQSYGEHPYSWDSEIVRGTTTDQFIVYATPVAHFFGVVFRPFFNGYLLFGPERGTAFFWCARFICLLLVWFELFHRIILRGKRLLSLTGAFMVALAPAIAWWFAINGLVEMMIFGALAILMIDFFMITKKRWHRLIAVAVIYMCGGGYVMTFYPASMVPLAYVFLALLIYVVYHNIRFKPTGKMLFGIIDAVMIIGMVAALGLSLYYIFHRSADTVDAIFNSAYPGRRFDTGRAGSWPLFFTWSSMLFPINGAISELNVCECARFIDFAPLGIILCGYRMVRSKKVDVLAILNILVVVFIFVYVRYGLSEEVARITLMSNTLYNRALVAYGLANLILMIRGMGALYEYPIPIYITLPGAAAYAFIAVFAEKNVFPFDPPYLNFGVLFIGLIIGCLLVTFFALNFHRFKKIGAVVLIGMVILGGGMVNPLQHGFGSLLTDELATSVQEIVNEDPKGLWIMESEGYALTEYLLLQGAPAINSVHTYPELTRWSKLDPTGEHLSDYNRYMHVVMIITPEDEVEETFALASPDLLQIYPTPSQIKNELNVSYIVSRRDLSELNSEDINFSLIKTAQGFGLYAVH